MLKSGLYEQVVNVSLARELAHLPNELINIAPLDKAEASSIFAKYLENLIKKGLDNIRDNGGAMADQLELVNSIMELIRNLTGEAFFDGFKVETDQQLLGLLDKNDPGLLSGKTALDIPRPESSVAASSLFTGALHEPKIIHELQKEIATADKIDFLISFIKWSGLRLLIEDLREFVHQGKPLRVITTPYIGATDLKAIDELAKLPNTQIKINYNTQSTRLHAKAYIFQRETGFATAYVGSSNMSNAALTTGLEWNTKISKMDLPETMAKVEATFEAYWNNPEFVTYGVADKPLLENALRNEKKGPADPIYLLDVHPFPYQQEILDKLEAEREVRGFNRNLVVAATGTGKTVISALDYRRFCKRPNSGKTCLLFVAHKEEILKQSLDTFRAVLKDNNFGELCVGKFRPNKWEYLFISIQSLQRLKLTEKLPKDFYDFIVVDEFHHAAAPSYQGLLEHFSPQILLGLTATPERMDGQNITRYFNDRFAAEIRLPEAINRNLLCPFQYFGVTDDISLEKLKWSSGGYDRNELSNIYTISGEMAKRRADLVIRALLKYVTDIEQVKCLGFCVSVAHAEFMCDYFNQNNLSSIFLTGQTPTEERAKAKQRLESGEVRFIFVVDLYNEGVDIPEVNTILFLRPTESLTVFLQQLGRGLRLAEGKECLTVLDFIGHANKKYNFAAKLTGLLTHTRKSLREEIRNGFISVPLGCSIKLEKKATEYILENLRYYFTNTSAMIEKIACFTADSGQTLTLRNFLEYHQLESAQLYKYNTFSRLCVRAGVRKDFAESFESGSVKIFQKFVFADSRRWLDFLIKFLSNIHAYDYSSLSPSQSRMLQMFAITLWGKTITNPLDSASAIIFNDLAQSTVLRHELVDLLRYNYDRIDFIDSPLKLDFDCPLDLHCSYTRDQILVALDYMDPKNIREGVKWLPDKKIDVFFITLNKSDKDYSPTTLYEDYSISDSLFHWQSQSTTSENSPTGQRYINHRKLGSKILLFAREYKQDRNMGIAAPYTFLGPAKYVCHNGSRPMNIIWRLDQPIPAKFLKKTNKLMLG